MSYEELLTIGTLKGIAPEDQLQIVGALFDLSHDHNDSRGYGHGLNLSNEIEYNSLSESQKIIFNYYVANGWAGLRKEQSKNFENAWNFQQLEISKEIYHLRKAISFEGFEKMPKARKCQILTNLGNAYNFIGRASEAQHTWSKALRIDPGFSMALANKGNGLYYYSRYIFDTMHAKIFIAYAYYFTKKALTSTHGIIADDRTKIAEFQNWLSKYIGPDLQKSPPDLNNFDLGKDPQLKNYRLWALENELFINPVADIGPYHSASHDALTLPTLIMPNNQPHAYINLYNQMKQEYGTARMLLYEALTATAPHYSDTDIVLIDTMEGARYSFGLEKMKIAYRLAYSLMDKAAYLVDDYLHLKIKRVDHRKLWYEGDVQKKILRQAFQQTNNWALRGLYWLTRDLYESEHDQNYITEPDAEQIATIRNHIEHKSFKILESLDQPQFYDKQNDLSYTISRIDFEKKTMKLLRLAKSAMIYLSLAIHHEERKKNADNKNVFTIESQEIPLWQKQ